MTEQERNAADVKKFESTVWGFFVKQFRVTWILIVAIIAWGLFNFFTLPRESSPEVKVPVGLVTTVFPGASPEDVEQLVTRELEQRISSLDGLNELTSNSRFGVSSIVAEFDFDVDLDEAIADLQDAVDFVESELPPDAEDPVVQEINFSAFAILEFTLSGELDVAQLQTYAEDLQDRLERVPDVSRASIIGGTAEEVQVRVDPNRLPVWGISLSQVVGAIQSYNLDVPVGDLTVGSQNYIIRLEGTIDSEADIRKIPLMTQDGRTVFIEDVAQVRRVIPSPDTVSRVSVSGRPAESSVSLSVTKGTSGSIDTVVEEAKSVVMEYADEVLPDTVSVTITTDFSEFITESFRDLTRSAIQTIIIVALLLYVVLGKREAVIAGLAIPLSFLITFGVIGMTGGTINNIVLFAMIIALGLLIDTAIVIVEGVFSYVQTGEYTPYEAALLAIRDFRWPLISGTMTTVAAFAPMLLVSGITGEFIKWLPITISIVLIASLVIALTVNPMIGSKIMKKKKHARNALRERIIGRITDTYGRMLKRIVSSNAIRRVLIGGSWALFFLLLGTVFLGLVSTVLFPSSDEDIAYISVEAPVGTRLEETDRVIQRIEDVLYDIPEIDNFVVLVGAQGSTGDVVDAAGLTTSSHLGFITVNFVEDDIRERTATRIVEEIRDRVSAISGADIFVQELGSGPPITAPIEVRITGPDLEELASVSRQVERIVQSVNGTTDVQNSYKPAPGEFAVRVDQQRARLLRVNPSDIAQVLQTAISGITVTDFLEDGDEIDVVLTFPANTVQGLSDITSLFVLNRTGELVPLSEVVRTSLGAGASSIPHRNEERIFRVRSFLQEGAVVTEVTAQIQQELAELSLPDGYAVELGGEEEEIAESFQSLFRSMIIGVILIFLILVLQFNSFKQPFIIMFTLPLAVIGVLVGLLITRQPLSFPSFLGIVGLAGIAVNDAIILIDRINVNRTHRLPFYDAVVRAGKERLQPIFLTTVTTIAGTLPLTLTNPFWAPFGVAIIFGLISASALTLVIVPALYVGFERKRAGRQGEVIDADVHTFE